MKKKIELTNPHDVETIPNIVSEIRKDKKPYKVRTGEPNPFRVGMKASEVDR